MENDQQPAAESATDIAAEGNVMDKVFGTFGSIVDNATSYVGSAATSISEAGADLFRQCRPGHKIHRREGRQRRQRRRQCDH